MDADQEIQNRTVNQGGRNEISSVELNTLRGEIPDDLSGVAYFNSICGSVNSGGIPFPKELEDGSPNPEFGTPHFNGDGMVYSMDMQTPGKVIVTSRLLRTPCYYADEATAVNGPAREEYPRFEFKNMGLARMSILLGTRNYINTALIPVSFENDSGESLLATVDNGRPYKLDPASLEILTPIGRNREWMNAMPKIMTTPFTMVSSTAHPSFDPVTKELFTVNYTQSLHTDTSQHHIQSFLRRNEKGLQQDLKDIASDYANHGDEKRSFQELKSIMGKYQRKRGFLRKLWDNVKSSFFKMASKLGSSDKVYLLKFDNRGSFSKWELVNTEGDSLVINQCMHQTSLSENYILLMDSSFKFAVELLFNNPFPEETNIDNFLRDITSKKMLPYTDMWIVRRKDLDPSKDKVTARMVESAIPFECIHFSTDYNDQNDELTIYTLHNNAACVAEWIRSFDVNYFTGKPYPDSLVGDFALGEMALGRVGKYVIDGQNATIKSETICCEDGNKDSGREGFGPNTWGIGLYAFDKMISASTPNRKIEKLHLINFGANPVYLTKWIHDLYEDYPNRGMELSELLDHTREGIPPSIISIRTSDMTITSYLPLQMDMYPMSIQSVPRKGSETGDQGYLLVTMKVPQTGNGNGYNSELWVLDASDVASGPLCVLAHPEFNFTKTLHSAWLAGNAKVTSGYQIDIREDYMDSVEKSLSFKRKQYRRFLNEYVFPHFD